jgi:hypothetical protein
MLSQAEYFNLRAKRYEQCLKVLPSARALDIIPYIHLLSNLNNYPRTICDAFGGSGFITNSFINKLNSDFVIADAAASMVAENKNKNISRIITKPNFANFTGKYDLIISHGGLHHAIVCENGIVDRQKSSMLQNTIVSKLVNSLNIGGYLVISDIPNKAPKEFDNLKFLPNDWQKFTQEWYTKNIGIILDAASGKNISSINLYLHKLFSNTQNVPQYFFDEYIAKNMPLGHSANYADFEALSVRDLKPVFRLNFCTPWIFNNKIDAGWFFREKFSIGKESAKPGECKQEDSHMFDIVSNYLGTAEFNKKTLVNWGLTYSAWQKT